MDDDGLPGWEQEENDERRRREEDEALVHCRKITAQSKREIAQFEHDMKTFWKQTRTYLEQ